jgi:O-succinylbenzoic acid--CoA ligase
MLTTSNFWWSSIGSALNLGTHSDDRWLACLPLFHVGGLSVIIRSAIYGITAIVHDGFEAERVNRAIDEDGATLVSVVAVMLDRMLDQRKGKAFPPTLRCIVAGGGPVSPALLERCQAAGAPVVQTYGLTESCSQVVTLSPADAGKRIGSAGKALYPNEIAISASDEILVRGPVVTSGYYNRPDDTAQAIVDGWLQTGDIGRIDEDGYLYVLDRRNDLIVSGGENV